MLNYPTTPSLTRLLRDSRRVPPLSRHAFEQLHIGRNVCWQLVYSTATPAGDGSIVQILGTQRTFFMRFGSYAFFQIDPQLYPALQTALPGRRLRVYGTILEIKTDAVILVAQTIEVLAKSFFDRFRY